MAVLVGVFAVLIVVVFVAGYRRVALGLLAVALAIGGWLYVHNREEEKLALSRIPVSELAFENVTLKPYVGSYKLAGRVRNNSALFRVRQIDFLVTVKDCIGTAGCVVGGESRESLLINVPPGEARDFEESVRFSGSSLKLKGRMEWSYSVLQIRAE